MWMVSRAFDHCRDQRNGGEISTGDLSQRINATDTESELGQLATVLNSTFARLETALRTETIRLRCRARIADAVSVILTQPKPP